MSSPEGERINEEAYTEWLMGIDQSIRAVAECGDFPAVLSEINLVNVAGSEL